MKNWSLEQEYIFKQVHIRGLISRIYEELYFKNPIKKWDNELYGSLKKIYKHLKICSVFFALSGIQTTTSLDSHITPVRMSGVKCIQRTSICDVATPSSADSGIQPLSSICTNAFVINAHMQISWWIPSPQARCEEGFSCPITEFLLCFRGFDRNTLLRAGCLPLSDFLLVWLLMYLFCSSVFNMLRLVENLQSIFNFIKLLNF